MTTNVDLLKAILAMDSYNREYGAGLVISGNAVGAATFIDHVGSNVSETEYSKWQSVGFYAAAYTLADGSTVIAYRGTNDLDISSSANDILNGWVAGAGTQAVHLIR